MEFKIEKIKEDKELNLTLQTAITLHDSVKTIQIKTSEDEIKGIEFGKKIVDAEKALKEQQKKWTAGAESFIKTVKDLIKPKLNILDEMKQVINSKMREYRTEIEMQRQKEIEKEQKRIAKQEEKNQKVIEKAIEKGKPIPIIDPIVPIFQPVEKTIHAETASVTYRKVKKYKIVNLELIPRAFMQINYSAIQQAMMSNIEVPGVEYYEEKTPIYK